MTRGERTTCSDDGQELLYPDIETHHAVVNRMKGACDTPGTRAPVVPGLVFPKSIHSTIACLRLVWPCGSAALTIATMPAHMASGESVPSFHR